MSDGTGAAGRLPQAVLFDMDGLLVDSEPLWYEVESAVMARLGGRWSPADQRALIGSTLDRAVTYLLGRARAAPAGREQAGREQAGREQVARWLLDGMSALLAERDVPLQPGAAALHAGLAAAGIPCALVTSSQPEIVAKVLDRTGLRFDAVVTGADVRHGKPHPEPYLRAAALLGAGPRSCAALEDSPTGAASAAAAGCAVVIVPGGPAAGWRGRVPAHRAASLTEVTPALLGDLVWRQLGSAAPSGGLAGIRPD